MQESDLQNRRTFWLIVVILLVATFFRTYRFQAAPPGLQHDEIFKANFATYILKGEFPAFFDANGGEEALYPYLTALSIALLGENYFALRLVAVLSGVVSIAILYRLTKELFGPEVALLTAAGVAISFWHIFDSRVGLRPITLLLLELTCFYLFWQGLRRGTVWFLASGFSLGLAQYTYTSAPLVAATLLFFALYLLIWHRGLLRRNLKGIILLFIVAAVVFIPMGYHLQRNPLVSTARVRDLSDHLRLLLQGDPRPILKDTLNVLGMFSLRGDPEWRYNLAGRPVFDPLTSLLFYGGLLISLARFKKPEYAFLLLWLPLNLITSAVTRNSPSTLRAIGALGAIYTLPSIAIVTTWRWLAQRRGEIAKRIAMGGIAALFLATALFTYRDYFLLWAQNPEVRKIYRADLTEVARYLNQLEGDTICISAEFAADLDQQVLNYMLGKPHFIRWFNGERSLVFPASEEVTYIFPATGPLREEWKDEYFSSLPVADTVLDPQGGPAFQAYRLGPGDLAGLRKIQPRYPLSANLDNQIELLGYDLASTPRAGEPLEIILYWRVLSRARGDIDYSFFLHLVDLRDYLWAQADSLGYPPSSWQEGDLVAEWFTLPIPPDTPPREYRLQVGLYDRATGKRVKMAKEPYLDALSSEPIVVAKATSIGALEIPQPRERNLDHKLTFLGRGVSRRRAGPGERIHVSIWWQAQGQPERDYALSVFLVDEEGNSFGELRRQPLDGDYPTSRWDAGEIVRDRFDYLIPPETPPGKYRLLVRVFDMETGEYLPLVGDSGDSIALSPVYVLERPREFALPSPEHPLAVNLGDQVTLLGYDLESKAKAGGELHLVLYWQAQREMSVSYTVFTHILDEEGRLWGQKDNPPQGGKYPTTGWLEGEVVRDEYEIPISPDAPFGLYLLEVGMYQAETGERLPAFDEEGNRLEGDRVILATIRIEE